MITKREEEREALREGGRRHGTILKKLAAMVVPGVSTQTLEDEARQLVTEGGDAAAFLGYRPSGAVRPFPAALCVSINDAIVHGVPNETIYEIQQGDVVTLDIGLVHEGFITDAAVTVIAGTGSKEKELLVRAAYEALDAGIAAAVLGNTLGDIGAAIEAIGKKYGFGSPRELAGHGVGRSVHEEPYVPNFGRPGKGAKLEEGMVIAIEPMFTLGSGEIVLDADDFTYRTRDGSSASHAEHTVLITSEGTEVLTKPE
jgi:methionyl aminopeptidase